MWSNNDIVIISIPSISSRCNREQSIQSSNCKKYFANSNFNPFRWQSRGPWNAQEIVPSKHDGKCRRLDLQSLQRGNDRATRYIIISIVRSPRFFEIAQPCGGSRQNSSSPVKTMIWLLPEGDDLAATPSAPPFVSFPSLQRRSTFLLAPLSHPDSIYEGELAVASRTFVENSSGTRIARICAKRFQMFTNAITRLDYRKSLSAKTNHIFIDTWRSTSERNNFYNIMRKSRLSECTFDLKLIKLGFSYILRFLLKKKEIGRFGLPYISDKYEIVEYLMIKRLQNYLNRLSLTLVIRLK